MVSAPFAVQSTSTKHQLAVVARAVRSRIAITTMICRCRGAPQLWGTPLDLLELHPKPTALRPSRFSCSHSAPLPHCQAPSKDNMLHLYERCCRPVPVLVKIPPASNPTCLPRQLGRFGIALQGLSCLQCLEKRKNICRELRGSLFGCC